VSAHECWTHKKLNSIFSFFLFLLRTILTSGRAAAVFNRKKRRKNSHFIVLATDAREKTIYNFSSIQFSSSLFFFLSAKKKFPKILFEKSF
jgi:hypothetical protein